MATNRFGEMEVFVRVSEARNFSAAARRLNLTPSAVAKLIGRLEERLGTRLINRTTRSLTLTQEGDRYYERASAILADIDEAESSISAGGAAPRGRLRVNCSIPFGTHMIAPLLPEFLALYPAVSVDLSLTDDVIDILSERSDVTIRHGPLKDSQLHARKLGVSRRLLVGAPLYLEKHGTPRTPADLARHNCLNFNFRRSFYDWTFSNNGERQAAAISGNVQVNNGETLLQLTRAGLGLSRLAEFHVADDIRHGRLVSLLDEYDSHEIEEIHVIYVGRDHLPLRVRAFIDFLAERVRIQCSRPAR